MEARKWTLKQHFEGMPKLSDFEITTEKIRALEDGDMRGFSNRMQPGQIFPGGQVARVIKSRNPQFPEGSQVVGSFGWRDLTIYKPGGPAEQGPDTLYKMPNLRGLPDSYALGACGMPGNTAYFGLLRLCEPKAGQTLVVSAAGGAVGSIVGQIGKLKGLKVIGWAGTEDKLRWLKNDLGFDHAFNYKTEDADGIFKQYAKEGIDCYFDNVGGDFTYQVTKNMNLLGRIALCGAITVYNNDRTKPSMVPFDYNALIYNQIRMEGFMVLRWKKEWFEGINQIRDWIIEGKIKVHETVTEGFDQMPQAFIDLLGGKNTGKQIIKA